MRSFKKEAVDLTSTRVHPRLQHAQHAPAAAATATSAATAARCWRRQGGGRGKWGMWHARVTLWLVTRAALGVSVEYRVKSVQIDPKCETVAALRVVEGQRMKT